VGAPAWLIALLGVFTALAASLYLFTYIYCLFSGREDFLRSETYVIQKLAIEKGFVGDNLAGIFKLEEAPGSSHSRLITGPPEGDRK
jgi:hypothetical protein